ncbi:hypothetical protein LOTGIDRAFT_174885 [Lottia gigantea]|uniref:Uncharacterized protein n=1 Tax=Lottia gigantea TaxID=225164 RepID=V4AHC2_LOTGI|nr:hypothetical protein LOTGIDRAFT_174885 [Lottia gigantea]ESO96317.1 hypothetical protein LOTGIDRAFT_174885 [Lottia gigantea]
MADEPMLSLFDADGGFMGELTNSSDGGLGTQEYNRGLPASENGMMNQGLPGMQVQRTMPAQPDMMMHQQQSQNLQGYPQHHNVAQNNFRGMNPQAVMMNRQPYPGQPDAYNQYNQVPKLHHMNDSNSIMMSGQNPNIMAQNIRQQAPQQQTFGSPPQNSLMPGQQPGYHNYNMSPRPRMASQAKQMGMVANSQWPPNQPQQSSPNQQQQYMAAQQNRQQQMIVGNNHMSSYPQQHDFNMQQQSQQSVGHYPNNTQQPQPHYMQGMRSPPTGNRMPMPMSPNNMNMMAQMQQRPIKPAQPFPHSQAATSQSNMMPNYNAHQTIQQPRFTGEYMSEGPQLTPGTNPQANHQHYSSFSGNQHVPVSPVATGMGDANALTHFTTNRSPNSMQYHQSYTGMGQPLPGQPGPQAPSPHSSSGSTTPSLLTNVSQGNFGQSSLQQLEQLVSPSVGGISAANPFQQVMQSTPNSNLNVAPKQMIYSSTNFQTTTVSSTGSVNGTPIQSGMSMSGTNGPVSAPINTDPSQPMMPSNPNHQQNVNMEVQRLQQQIQHLYNMPQTQQIQQQMLDLQEKMRMLKAQQQQHFLQMQKQQIQPRPNLVGAPPNHNIPGQQQVRMPQPNPGNPTVPQMNTTQVMGVQQQSNIPSQSKDSNIPPPQFGQYGNQQNMLPSLGDSIEILSLKDALLSDYNDF